MTSSGSIANFSGFEGSIVQDGKPCSASDMRRAALQLGERLSEAGVTRVALATPRADTLMTALIACQQAECEILALRDPQPQDSPVWATSSVDALLNENLEIVRLGSDESTTRGRREAGSQFTVLLGSSGTTGAPKIASHEMSRLMARVQRPRKKSEVVWLLTYPPASFAGMQVVLTSLVGGGTLVAQSDLDVGALAQLALEHQPTHVCGTPTFCRALLLNLGDRSRELKPRYITLGGEPIDQGTLDRLAQLYPDAVTSHVYGSTEAGALFAVKDGKAGFPAAWLDEGLPDVQMRIRQGILEVLSARAMKGYVSGKALITDDGWLITNDRVELRGDPVMFLGRIDMVINVGGAKVSPEEVEAVVLEVEGVTEVRVVGFANPITGQVVGAEIVLAEGAREEDVRKDIARTTRATLKPYQVPRILTFVDEIRVAASEEAETMNASSTGEEMQNSKRCVVVTGGSRGLGLVLIQDLLAAGYSIATCSRKSSTDLEDLLASAGSERLVWHPCTIGDAQSEEQFFEKVVQWVGTRRFYGLVNNAAIAMDGILATFPNVDSERILEVNLLGTLRMSRLALRELLKPHLPGRILNISSIIGSRGYTGLAAYSASKAGMDGLTRALAREMGRRGITVNSVAPGYLETEMSSSLTGNKRQQIVNRTPMKRLGTSADVSPLVRFLLSDEAAFITGQTILVDGGITC